jgi:glucokinase
MLRIGIDIGGTSAKLGLVDPDGRVLSRVEVLTGRDMTAEDLVTSLADAIFGRLDGHKAEALGIAAPGMRRDDGEGVVNVTNLPHIDGYPLREKMQEATGLRTVIDNDANAAAMGEARFGGGRGVSRLLVMTLGTGIGAGMVVDGQIHRMAWQGLGDPGHVIVQRNGPLCGCGGHGCVEKIAAVPALLQRAAEAGMPNASFGDVVIAARCGNTAVSELLQEGGEWIGMALATLVHVLGPERILLGGGGIDAAKELLFEPIHTALFAHCQPFLAERLTLARAALGNDAGLVGAAALVL